MQYADKEIMAFLLGRVHKPNLLEQDWTFNLLEVVIEDFFRGETILGDIPKRAVSA